MATTVTDLETDITRRRKVKRLTVAFTGNYATGGDTINFTQMLTATAKVTMRPRSNTIAGTVVTSPAGYLATLIKGQTLATWKLMLYSAPGVELAAGAYPAALLAATAIIEVHGKIGQV